MKNIVIILTIFCLLPLVIVTGSHAAVTELRLGVGKTWMANTVPSNWQVWYYPQYVTYDYQKHQISFSLYAGEYVCFEIGMTNVDGPASLFVDKIELIGPSGEITIYNSDFETGVHGWSAWGSRYVEGEFTTSEEAYEGSKAGKLTLFGTGPYSLHGQVPTAISQYGTYTLSAYTKVQEGARVIPPDAVFAMEVGNLWEFDGSSKEEIVELDHSTFRRDTFKLRILENNIETGYDWYEVWKGYWMYWGFSDGSETYQFGDGLLLAWIPASVGESKVSVAWILNYNIEVKLTTTFLLTEQITLNFDTLESYRFRYNFALTGPGGTAETTFDQWYVPYIGLVKQQEPEGMEYLVSFRIAGGRVSEVSDNDQDGLLDYKELTTYHTDPAQGDTDLDGCLDGAEVQAGRNPLIADSKGDVNGDCVVNLADAISALALIAGMDEVGTSAKKADVNGDGRIGSEELIWILQRISGSR